MGRCAHDRLITPYVSGPLVGVYCVDFDVSHDATIKHVATWKESNDVTTPPAIDNINMN